MRATGRPLLSRIHGYRVSYAAYRDYGLLVYGTPAKFSDNQYDPKTGQYAKLGYSYDEMVVTNSLFRDDSPGGVTQTTPWQWNELDMGQAARISWSRLNASQKAIIYASQLTYRDNSYGGMTFSALKLTENKSVVVAPPSWHMGFALYTTHYLPGSPYSLRYATFNGRGAGSVDVSCEIQMDVAPSANGKYVLRRDADSLTIPYDICGSITALHGLASEEDIQTRGVGNEQGWSAGVGWGPWMQSFSLQINREDLNEQEERNFTLQGYAWAVSSHGDIQLTQIEKTITVCLEAAEVPFAVETSIKGSIHYFSGQTNHQGQTLPVNPHRFLGLERMIISLDFTQDPSNIELLFNQNRIRLNCVPGVRHYETNLIVPALPSTLTWDDRRLSPPLRLSIMAVNATGSAEIEQAVQDIEVTGDVYDITFAQNGFQ